MSSTFRTEQESFWAGSFGDSYTDRNQSECFTASRTGHFSKAIARTAGVASILELGANVGQNILALRALLPAARFSAVEINAHAVEALRTIRDVTVHHDSILRVQQADLGMFDLTFTSGVLIHIDPSALPTVYRLLYACSRRYVLINEYYNPTPVEVPYRGHDQRLFKRDFAGEMLDLFPDLALVDYGFQYRRDPAFPASDTTWFMMEKRAV